MPAVDECERGAASAAGMIAMIGAGTVRPPPWMANGGRRGQVSASGTKAVQRGVHSVHRGECRPSGCGRSARTSPMLGTKPSTGGVGGEWRPTWTSFPHLGRKPSRGAFIQLTGANAGHRVGNDLREAGTDKFPRSGRKPSREALVRFFAGGGHAPVMTPVSPVTRIQSLIKGKAQKNAFLQNQ